MAAHVLRRALELKPGEPLYLSYLGLCMAIGNRRSAEALSLCEEAIVAGCHDANLYCNLGRVHLLQGRRSKAHRAFLAGLKVEPRNRYIVHELRTMGIRKVPLLHSLPRGHVLNRLAGRLRHMLRRPAA